MTFYINLIYNYIIFIQILMKVFFISLLVFILLFFCDKTLLASESVCDEDNKNRVCIILNSDGTIANIAYNTLRF